MPLAAPALTLETAPRQCGRCRQLFEGDPTLHPDALPEWWLCPTCRTALLGVKPTTDDVTAAPER